MILPCVIAIWSQKSRFWEARDETKCFNPENSVIFSLTWFTFWSINQLSDVTAWQIWLEMKAETQGILTHLIRARKNVYLIIYRPKYDKKGSFQKFCCAACFARPDLEFFFVFFSPPQGRGCSNKSHRGKIWHRCHY